jgi:xanthine dehydrogenase accessory factor
VVRFGVSDEAAWDVGLACGGTIDVLVQPAVPDAVLRALHEIEHDRRAGRVIVTVLPAGSPEARLGASEVGTASQPKRPLVVYQDGRLVGSLGTASADEAVVEAALTALADRAATVVDLEDRQLFVETFAVRPRLVVIGAVAVAETLVRMAASLGYETAVIDGRPAFATRERFPEVDELLLGWPDEVADDIDLGPDDAVAVLSHDPKFDEPAIAEALHRECRYVGAIGSRKTQHARRARLLERGLSQAQLQRLRGPIGLDLGGREPAETALAIMSEIVADRHDASGRPMRDLLAERASN